MVLGHPYGIGQDPHAENHYPRLSDMLSQGMGSLFLHVWEPISALPDWKLQGGLEEGQKSIKDLKITSNINLRIQSKNNLGHNT